MVERIRRLMKEDECKKKMDEGEWLNVNYTRAKTKFPKITKNQTFFYS